ncbi:hypothetical protein [Lignipirellula cremea]|uniref:Uncharacterized protein n=1 Tax=Lignipirellula cremea TaxID=2528010 RepID=A0A518DS08_9BACT|nr:hypothetical protein [Lignipirellula cremea]QDU94613.1 hypothetical protein Pla8534_24060 [Lignipirellula cremea]
MGRFAVLALPLLAWVVIVFLIIGLGSLVARVLTAAVEEITFPQALLIGVIATVAATHWIITLLGLGAGAIDDEEEEEEETDEFYDDDNL